MYTLLYEISVYIFTQLAINSCEDFSSKMAHLSFEKDE